MKSTGYLGNKTSQIAIVMRIIRVKRESFNFCQG